MDFPKAGLMVMMRLKATHSAASLAFQSMWGSYLAGWMADQRLTGLVLRQRHVQLDGFEGKEYELVWHGGEREHFNGHLVVVRFKKSW
jgi:hypothetical protein